MFVFNGLVGEVIVCFVDIGDIVNNDCLSFILITSNRVNKHCINGNVDILILIKYC